MFINYRGVDSRSYGALLYTDLVRRFGEELVFRDADSIPAGGDYVEELLARVRSARVVLAVIGPTWLSAVDATGRRLIDDPGDWVRRELAEAFAAGVRVIPVLIDDAELPAAGDLPRDISALSRRQARHLRHRESTRDLDGLVAELTAMDEQLAAAERTTSGTNPHMTELDLAIQQAIEWDSVAEHRDLEYRTQLLVRAMGGHGQLQGWWFCGRQAALADITAWLDRSNPTQPLLAVTAGPGSGKTAVLGLIATLSHPERRASVPLRSLGLEGASVPAPHAVDVVVYAHGLTTDQVLRRIAAAARIGAEKHGELLDRLTARVNPLTVLVDALDEAADPVQLARHLLRPLAEHADGRLRLLVGTRPHLLVELGLRREDSVDLDAARYADPDALTTYVMRGLLDAVPDSPFRGQDPSAVRDIARVVAQASAPSFLVARITSSTLAAQPTVPDLHDQNWQRALPRLPGDAMRRDLETRLGDEAERARNLLRPLAFAEGQGLPWEDIWAQLASRIAAAAYTDDDVLWLRRHAGSFVEEVTDEGRSAYRLYHQALAEYLRDGTDVAAVHREIAHVLCSRVPRNPDGSRDWARAHHYTLRHLATHAARSGLLDEIVDDTDYLVHASPDELLATFSSVVTDDGRLTRSIYNGSVGLHRHLSPARRRQVLATDAARFAATRQHRALAAPLAWPPRWATGRQTSPALHTTLSGHRDSVRAVACTMIDGRPVAVTGGDDATARVWDLTTGALRAELTGHRDSVRAVACTMIDGRPVAVTGGDDATARVWDLTTGTLRATLAGHSFVVHAVACTTIDNQPVAVTGDLDGIVRVWDLRTGTVRSIADNSYFHGVAAVACTTIDGQPMAVTISHVGFLVVCDLVTGAKHTILDNTDERTGILACTTIGGRPVAVTSLPWSAIGVWDLTTGAVQDISMNNNHPYAVACTTIDGLPTALTGDNHGVVTVWDLATGTATTALTGHRGGVWTIACTTINGRPMALTGGSDGTVRVWSLGNAGGHNTTDTSPAADITAVARTSINDRPVAVTANGSGDTTVWDLTTGIVRTTLTGHHDPVYAVTCTTIDGHSLAVTGGHCETVRVWDLTTGALRAELTGHDTSVHAVACTTIAGQPVAVTGDFAGTVRVWDLTTCEIRSTLTGHENNIQSVACAVLNDRPVAITASHSGQWHGFIHPPTYYQAGSGTMRVWDLATGILSATFTHHKEIHEIACATLDGRPVAVTAGDGSAVLVRDLTTNAVVSTLTGHRSAVHAVACTVLDGRPVAVTASGDNTVRIWDLATSKEVALLDYRGQVLCTGPTEEIIIGTGWDLVVVDRRPDNG